MLVTFYSAYFLYAFSTISLALYNYPLFPLKLHDLEWSNVWLVVGVIDYYGACLCLCGVILSSERDWRVGVGWVLGCCLLGSPVCCAWVLQRVFKGGASALQLPVGGYRNVQEG
jgi:hypothetical protein